MASAVDSRLAYARLSAVATASRLPTANRGSNNSYTTSWDTTAAYRGRRCLIPADGFYEWARRGAAKQPWLIGLKDGVLFAFAGLWERWMVPRGIALAGSLAELEPGEVIETCTILTTAANEIVAPVHDRMPVILPPEVLGPWLAGEAVPLDPYPPETMTLHPVSTLVNKPAERRSPVRRAHCRPVRHRRYGGLTSRLDDRVGSGLRWHA